MVAWGGHRPYSARPHLSVACRFPGRADASGVATSVRPVRSDLPRHGQGDPPGCRRVWGWRAARRVGELVRSSGANRGGVPGRRALGSARAVSGHGARMAIGTELSLRGRRRVQPRERVQILQAGRPTLGRGGPLGRENTLFLRGSHRRAPILAGGPTRVSRCITWRRLYVTCWLFEVFLWLSEVVHICCVQKICTFPSRIVSPFLKLI